jgi:hypothetical protein
LLDGYVQIGGRLLTTFRLRLTLTFLAIVLAALPISIYTSVTVKNFIVCALGIDMETAHSSKELYFLNWNERMGVSGFVSKELYCFRTDALHKLTTWLIYPAPGQHPSC